MSTLVGTQRRAGATWLILDSPANRNALSVELIAELRAGLAEAAADDARAVVLSHTGNTFCAGVDLNQARTLPADRQPARLLVPLLRDILAHPKPVIAAVDGHVRAGGMGLVGACDLAVATDGASFGLTEVRLGLAASVISLVVLPRLQDRDAARLLLGGASWDADRMRELEFISDLVADLDAGVAGVVDEFARSSPQGLAETKRILNAALLDDFDARSARLAEQSAYLFTSEEAAEGMAAFAEKRPPRWDIRVKESAR